MKDNYAFLNTSRFWKEILVLVLGLLAGAAGVYYFLLPSNLILGSISGLAMITCSVLETLGLSVKVSMMVLILNSILLILAYIFLGSEVGFKTVIASLLLGPFIEFWEFVCPYTSLMEPGMNSVMGSPIFDLLAYVLLIGASQAFLFRINASTGGLDILAMIMKKYCHWDIGTSVTIVGILVCISAFAIHPFYMVVIGIIGTWINGTVVDFFTASINKRKRVCIISGEYERICQYIIQDLYRGCSLYRQTGGYSNEENIEIQSILTQSEFGNLMNFIRDNDIKAFITAGNCSEVYGLWRAKK